MDDQDKSSRKKAILTLVVLAAVVGIIFFVATNATNINLPSHGDFQKLHG